MENWNHLETYFFLILVTQTNWYAGRQRKYESDLIFIKCEENKEKSSATRQV